MEKKVIVIPAKENIASIQKVGVYCRVSSSSSAQLHSLSAQASYLTRYVMARIDWRLTDIYIDVASGSSTTGRDEFNRMMNDAKNGLLNLIITKSISRFGRNSEDVITATRALLSYGVSVIFEEQTLNSWAPESELYIALFSGMAQDENLNLSENIKWGIRKRVEDGTSCIYNRTCYGYCVDDTDTFLIVPEEAAVIRRIFAMYLSGMSILRIQSSLKADGILTPTGKSNWSKRTIDTILSNKKYCGFSVVKIKDINYECKNHHEPIIPLEIFEKVQSAKFERSNVEIGEDGKRHRKNTKYSSKKNDI